MLTYFLAFIATFSLTYFYRVFALKNELLDVPNARSAHTIAMPRGGGLCIAFVFIVYCFFNLLFGIHLLDDMLFFIIGLASVTIIGFFDDKGHISVAVRLIVHLFSCSGIAWVLWTTETHLTLLDMTVKMNIFFFIFVVLGLAWLLNLFNFMDGINGIATTEAITTSIAAATLLSVGRFESLNIEALTMLHWFFAASCLGFLVWNFPVARIFLGDSGSGFIGLLIGGLIVQSYMVNESFLWSWLILLGVFVVDSTYTLAKRLLTRKKIYEAHRSHAYQRVAQQLDSHTKVTLSVFVINLFWLLPIAALVTFSAIPGPVALAVAYTPLIWIANYFGAGEDPA